MCFLKISGGYFVALSKTGIARGFQINTNSYANISNCEMLSSSISGQAQAIASMSNKKGNFTILIVSVSSNNVASAILATGNTDVNVEGGTYTASTGDGKAYAFQNTKNVKNATIKAYATNDSKSYEASVEGIIYGSSFSQNILIENTNIICDYNAEKMTNKDDFNCNGITINAGSTSQSLIINNCNIKATREALMLNTSNVYINGGTYEGVQHGGAYFSCSKAIVKNATFRKWNYDGQFNKNNFYSYNAAFYIGNPDHEVKVYMDNCKLENAKNASISSNYSFKNTYLYASNTAFNNIRIDGANSNGDKGHMYIGKGTTYRSTSGSGELDKTTYKDIEFTPEYVEANF